MKCYIEHDFATDGVKVWLFDERPEGIVWFWPLGYPDEKSACMTWRQEIVPHHQQRPDNVRPAFELSGWMWKPFLEAIRAEDYEMPAGKLLFDTLKREQNRVDALITHLIKSGEPQWLISKGESIGG